MKYQVTLIKITAMILVIITSLTFAIPSYAYCDESIDSHGNYELDLRNTNESSESLSGGTMTDDSFVAEAINIMDGQYESYTIQSDTANTFISVFLNDEDSITVDGAFYRLDGYGLCINKILMDPIDSRILYCSIDTELNNLQIVFSETAIKINVYNIQLEDTMYVSSVSNEIVNESSDRTIYYNILDLNTIDNEAELDFFLSIANTETWCSRYGKENQSSIILSNIEAQSNEISANATTLRYIGTDKAVDYANNVLDYYVDISYLTTAGRYSGVTYNSQSEIIGFWNVYTYFNSYDGHYVTLIAVWSFDYNIIFNSNQTSAEGVGTIQKKFNLQVHYTPNSATAYVYEPGDSSTYLISRNFSTMFKITGSYNNAYITRYSMYANKGGNSSSSLIPETALSLMGKLIPYGSYFNALYSNISDFVTAIDNYNYNNTLKAYEVYNGSTTGYTRAIASTYSALLFKRYSQLESRCIVVDLPTYARSMYYQIEYDIMDSSGTLYHYRVVLGKSLSPVYP